MRKRKKKERKKERKKNELITQKMFQNFKKLIILTNYLSYLKL